MTVAGLGYVGCVTAACLADLGHRVIGFDRDAFKVEMVNAGRSPFYEPGLDNIVKTCRAAGRLSATTEVSEALRDADIVLVCVGTPSEKNGNLGLDQITRVCKEIAEQLPSRSKRLIVAIRSTVYPGTCDEVVRPLLGDETKAAIVDNPEFLREGSAVRDFIDPALLVIGGSDETAVAEVAALYTPLKIQPSLVSTRTAEMIKYACNSFHAVKVAFANEIGALCDKMDIPAQEVMETFCRDTRLNISPAYLKPGFAFGGSCLPKDLRALTYRASRLDLSLPLLEAILPSNHEHLRRGIEEVLDLPAGRIGVYGLAFKENTDDLRESPVVTLLEHLIGKGREVRVFDAHISIDSIYGTNRNFVLQAIPHIGRLMVTDASALFEWADHIVVSQKPSPELAARLAASGRNIIDLSGAFRDERKTAVVAS